MQYDEHDIILHVGPRAMEAGRSYQRQRRVTGLLVDGQTFASQVQGGERRPYRQQIEVMRSTAGGIRFRSECSCPVGEACKHVAAVLLEGLSRKRIGESVASTSIKPLEPMLPGQLAAWLSDLEDTRSRSSDDYPASVQQRIVYIFDRETRHDGAIPRLELRILTTRLLKDGSFSQRARAYDWRSAVTASGAPKYLRPSDLRIFRALQSASNEFGYYSSILFFSHDNAIELVESILATGRARWQDVAGVALDLGPERRGRAVWEMTDGDALRLRLDAGEGLAILNAAPPIYLDEKSGLLGPVDIGMAPGLAFRFASAPPAPLEHAALLAERMAQRFPDLAALAPPPPAPPVRYTDAPALVLRLFRAELPSESGARSYVPYYGWQEPTEPVGLARVFFRYGSVDVAASETKHKLTRLHQGGLIEIHRDRKVEASAFKALRAHGFLEATKIRRRTPQKFAADLLPSFDSPFAWHDALYHALPELRRLGWNIEIDPDFPVQLLTSGGDIEANLLESSGIDWLDLDLGVTIDGERIDLVQPVISLIQAAGFKPDFDSARAEENVTVYLPLMDGRFLAMPKARLAQIIAAIWDISCGGAWTDADERVRLSRHDLAGLAAFEEAAKDAGLSLRGGEILREMGRKLTISGGIPEIAPPSGFRADLRAYQKQGVAWLVFLRSLGLGGVLADDMGLGKTIQALALIAIEKAAGRLDGPTLVIAPTSLVANWRRETRKFAPDLSVLVLHGVDRKNLFSEIEKADIVFTTYPLVSRDYDTLCAHQWSMLFLDEAQTIKNPNAATTKLIRSLEAGSRFCLTGTPLENHLGELWSIFSFAMPGFLGDLSSFSKAFRTPIEKSGDPERARLLSRRIKPFLLRRTKEEVAGELPPKTEIIEHVEMDKRQQEIYESIRLAMHKKVREAISRKGFARSRIIILEALLKLRQCCCDPRLLKLSTKLAATAGSAKLERLMEMLEELMNENRRVLVFSQFTTMLDLIRPELDRRSIPYSLLTGETRDRATEIDRFQDGGTRIFLVSLKAGGVGLNLTAADTVILYDPWWNPAVEDQAVDRAHRIGQQKAVFVHRLVASGTIEEKMAVLKEKKRSLADSIFDPDGAPTLAMTEDDLEALFAPI